MRVVTGSAVFLVVTAVGLGVVDSGASVDATTWQRWVVVALALVAAAVVNRVLFGRRYGWGDGGCEVCRGFGKAFYGTGRRTYRARCRACGGSGSGHGRGTYREPDREPVRR